MAGSTAKDVIAALAEQARPHAQDAEALPQEPQEEGRAGAEEPRRHQVLLMKRKKKKHKKGY